MAKLCLGGGLKIFTPTLGIQRIAKKEISMNESFIVSWRGAEIGRYEITGVDMWYTDGNWVPNDSEKAIEFIKLVRKFDIAVVFKFPEKGTRILLENSEDRKNGINALVIGFVGDQLSLRRVFNKEAIAWLIKNVK